MVPYETSSAEGQPVSSHAWMAADQAPGKVILTASKEGCVFTQLPVRFSKRFHFKTDGRLMELETGHNETLYTLLLWG